MVQPAPAYVALLAALARDPRAADLSHRHLQIVALLCAEPDPERRSPTVLAEQLRCTPNGVSRASRRLRELGLIARDTLPDNARFAVFSPTAKGRALDRWMQTLFADLTRAAPEARVKPAPSGRIIPSRAVTARST